MNHYPDWPQIGYEQARAAFDAGQKLHLGGRAYLVRPVLTGLASASGGPPILWVSDEQTTGDHGLILFPDGRVEVR